ncbi:MAG TPA: DUF4105 domain-containing protein [Moraxellaceae bacterium]|nr:DUF4105 domain-containing protein [Moraxellaceae bacterium]
MKSPAVAILVALLAGCAAMDQPGPAAGPDQAAGARQEQVRVAVRHAPPLLRQAILEAAAAGRPGIAPTGRAPAPPSPDVQAGIAALVAHSRGPLLSPDAEFTRLYRVVAGDRPSQAAFAQAVAGYATQPDYACRHPLYAHYLERRYAAEQKPEVPCPAALPLLVLDRYENPQVVWLDPGRVKAIHLLFAGNSGEAASRFGHVALRLVVCPEGDTSPEACDTNLFEHLVLGFQAQIDEFSLDIVKALTGGYRAYLFANRFMDVYEQYAIGEFRDVYSLPLRLDEGQREFMLRALADIHWRYAGDYSFFTRNCATLLQQALRASWPPYAADKKLADNFLRPDRFFDALRASPLADGEKLASLQTAEHDGYYFPSTQAFYRQALQVVNAAMKTPAYADLEGYLLTDPVIRRHNRNTDPRFLQRLAADRHLREAQIMLEEVAILRGERRLLQAGALYLARQDFTRRADRLLARLDAEHALAFNDCLLLPIRQISSPLRRLDGIPATPDIDGLPAFGTACTSARQKDLLREAVATIGDTESEQWKQLDRASTYLSTSIDNLDALKNL